ncbi:MAG TPA: type II secretion system protein [Candidatus Paceibacterota bacterium]|jgi:prepilin-type N-terminal cleavage/methylation domain-containing protein|nr:type II secretion system protein [Candidatus Paceibacterota bacterium]
MINKLFIQLKTASQGFTLIETLVAILLLVSAIAGPLTIAAKGLSAAVIARDQMVAFYLAQDAVEYVRFVRDSNKLSGASWLTNLSDCTGATGCYLDTLGNDVDSGLGGIQPVNDCPTAASGGCPPLNKYNDGSGHTYFSYLAGAQTPQKFVRTITLTTPTTGETSEEVLSVVVSWRTQANITRSITVRENLLDWQ